MFENTPTIITELLTQSLHRSQNIRGVRKIIIKRFPNSKKEQKSLIYKAVFLYNKMSDILKTYNLKKFKKKFRGFYISQLS